ncbi:hypothetical protein LWI29_031969 [Acer saccharum]|uniref:CBS domain-containing protein n=1 Tax=Acer saccharum TaxID=4024 RepID=A0AA39TA79_ACESA|nr:hypothetical protein LWI29_031969 [Acer saccharum]
MTVAIPLLTEITLKSIAVHNATEVLRLLDALILRITLHDMIENVLEIKDTHVREVMTPLVDVVAIDASASLVDFHNFGVPVFVQSVDNIVGIAYAMDMLDYVPKGELQESTSVGDMARKPAYFVPDSMPVWILLREFRYEIGKYRKRINLHNMISQIKA